jgi:hypothetical protein
VSPAAPAAPAPAAGVSRDDDRQVFSTYAEGWRVRVESQGIVELTDDRRDVKSVSPNGYFELTSRGWLSLFGRRYLVRGNPDGTITRRLFVGASERPLNAAALAWVGDDIQRIARQGFAANAWIRQVLVQKGAAAAFEEVGQLNGDYSKAQAVLLLLDDLSPVTPEAAQLVTDTASRYISSDVEKARVLIRLSQRTSLDGPLADRFAAACDTISSDFEHSRVLLAVVDQQSRTGTVLNAVIASSGRISSDFEKARVLTRIANAADAPPDVVPALTRAASSISSDFERGRVLSAIALRQAK